MPLPILEQKNITEWLHDFLVRIYPIFQQTLGNNSAVYNWVSITLKKRPIAKIDEIEYEWWFHHIVTKEISQDCNDREFCLPRAERIRFPRYYIDSVPTLKVWQRIKNNEQKYYISDDNFDYLVVLSQRKDYIVFITAFPVERNHYKGKLLKEYEECRWSP